MKQLALSKPDNHFDNIPEIQSFHELIKEFPPEKYNYNLFEAHLEPKEYDRIISKYKNPTARQFYNHALQYGRTLLIPEIKNIESLKRTINRIIKTAYFPTSTEERKIYSYYITAYEKGKDRHDRNTKTEDTPLQAIIEYQK